MTDIVFRNATVVTPDGVLPDHDVAVSAGMVTGIGERLPDTGESVPCDGAWLGPGFVDMHVHFREPGQEHKEDIATGSAAAAAGGFTAVVAMPNTSPAIDAGHTVGDVLTRGRRVGLVEVAVAGCLSADRKGNELAPLDELWDAGVRVFSDDGDTLADSGLMRQAMEFVAARGGVISQHCIDAGLGSGHMHEGEVSRRLGIAGIPSVAEEIVIARDLALARLTGARYHVQHLSTAEGLHLVAQAKTDGVRVTAEVTPHHLMFDDRDAASGDTSFKMMPPLRSPDDAAALRAGLRDRVIDCVATDHAPHAEHEKAAAWEDAPNGVTGLEWSAAAVQTSVGLAPQSFFDAMAVRPARIAGLERHGNLAIGSPANLVVFDPAAPADTSLTRSKSRNAPYLGRDLTGRVVLTMFEGRFTFRRGRVQTETGGSP